MAHVTYTIFLASSEELAADRTAFAALLQEFNQSLKRQKMQAILELYVWEWDLVSFADRRKQDKYNKNIESCHIFVMLYGSKVGMYTEEEYDFAYNRFKTTGAPQIIVFERSGFLTVEESVPAFQEKVSGRDEQYTSGRYADAISLKNQFITEVYKFFANGILPLPYAVSAVTLYNDGQSVPANFTGRAEELKNIWQKLDKGGALMLINAEGGIGKTTVAAKYWQESLYLYKHNAWLFCENGIVAELKKLAPGLGLDLSNRNEEEQIAALKTALQNISHNFLLVLDNANRKEDIEAFQEIFRGLHWHVLITSRCNGVLEDAQEYQIMHLPPQQARDLFTSNYKEEGPTFNTLLDRLLQAIDYHTLLVEIFSKNMKELRMRGETLKDFLEQLQTKGLFLEERSFRVPTDYTLNRHKKAPNTDAILEILYDFSDLEEEERYYLVNMVLLPAVPHAFTFLCDIFGQDKFKFKTLEALAGKGWVGKDTTHYRISPVIQKIALAKNKAALPQDAKVLIDNLNAKLENNGTYLKYFNEAGPYAALAESITRHLISQPFYALSLLNFNACTYYISTGDLITALAYAEQDKTINKKLEDINGLAISYSKLGGINETMGRLNEALQFYEEYKRLEEALHRDYPGDVSFKNGLAISYARLGIINEKLGRLNEALQFYEDYQKLSKELHRDYPGNVSFKNGLAVSYIKLAGIFLKQSTKQKAIDFYTQAESLWQQLAEHFPGYAEFNNNLGWVQQQLNTLKD